MPVSIVIGSFLRDQNENVPFMCTIAQRAIYFNCSISEWVYLVYGLVNESLGGCCSDAEGSCERGIVSITSCRYIQSVYTERRNGLGVYERVSRNGSTISRGRFLIYAGHRFISLFFFFPYESSSQWTQSGCFSRPLLSYYGWGIYTQAVASYTRQ